MTDAIAVALITAGASVVVGGVNALLIMRVHKQGGRIEVATNGLQAQLLSEAKAASHAAGMEDQRMKGKVE